MTYKVCTCGHPQEEHINNERQCTGKNYKETAPMDLLDCTCPRYKFWYDDDEKLTK